MTLRLANGPLENMAQPDYEITLYVTAHIIVP